MNKNYLNFISFARGIQYGYNPNDIPLLEEENAQQVYDRVLSSLCSAYDIERDILGQYTDGELDSWETVEQLEDELGYSYDGACKKVSALFSSLVLSGNYIAPVFDFNARAFWIGPDGKILPVYETHIKTVWDCPPAFGYTQEDLEAVYDRYGDRYRSEGEARNFILRHVIMDRGWIRIRFHQGGNYYHIEIGKLQDKHKSLLWDWANALIEADSSKASIKFAVHQFGKGDPDFWGSLQDLVDFRLFSSHCLGIHYLIPIEDPYDFLSVCSSVKGKSFKRKRSKYHGALVNNTFDDAPTGLSTASTPSAAPVSANLKTHPSIRFLVVNHILHPTRRHLIKSSLSGSLDTLLYQTYCAGLGDSNPKSSIKHTGKNGRVMLKFTSDSGHSTEVDLGGSLDVGYVVQQIDDGLGLFPEGTEIGDLIKNKVIQEIVQGQGERDKGSPEDVFSSVVLKAKVEDDYMQTMVDEVSAALRGVDDRLFPEFQYLTAEKRGEQFVLCFLAKGVGFELYLFCGSDGHLQKAMFGTTSKKVASSIYNTPSPEALIARVNYVGARINSLRKRR